MIPGDTDNIKREYEILLGELQKFNPAMLDKHRVLAVTKSDLLDDELIEMLREELPTDLPVIFISSVAQIGLQELKDTLWKELNSESNKLEAVAEGGALVHRDREVSVINADFIDWEPDYEDEDGAEGDVYDLEDLEDV